MRSEIGTSVNTFEAGLLIGLLITLVVALIVWLIGLI